MRGLSSLFLSLCSLCTVLPVPRAGAQSYTVTDLGTLGGTNSLAQGINGSGQVVGYAYTTGDGAYHAFRTTANAPINPATDDLGTLGGTISFAQGINGSGQVVGYATITGETAAHAFRTAANSPINPATDDLGTLGGANSFALGINGSGQVVGYAYTTGDGAYHAFRTTANAPINPATDDLGSLGGTISFAQGINGSGQVVGHAYTFGDGAAHAFRTAANSPINPATDDLGTLGGTNSFAMGVNGSGQVVGYAYTTGAVGPHAFQTAANAPINPAMDDLGTLGGTYSVASGINASSQVVGYATTTGDIAQHAFLYSSGVMHDLNSLIPSGSGWELLLANGINDAGQIVGAGTVNGQTHAFLLTPVTDRVTSLADDGSAGTLRYAINNANSGGTIRFDVTGTITLTQGALEVSKDLTINGPGPASLAISGNNASTVFHIDSGTTVAISGVTIENGSNPFSGSDTSGRGGGILNEGSLTLTDTAFSGNSPGSNGYGACIFNGYYQGGAKLEVSDSTFSGNNNGIADAGYGGCIWNSGIVTVRNSTFSDFIAGGSGGVIWNNNALMVVNSTFSGNYANGGGAIFNNGAVTVSNSTFAGNNAPAGGDIYNIDATITLKNTLLANTSMGGNCFGDGGTIVSNGHNLSDDNSCTSFFNQIGDVNNTPAGLDPAGLKNSGGPTKTIALLSTSPAVDAIPVSPTNYCTAVDGTTPITTDQRGIARPHGTACDIGAVEIRAASVAITLSPNPSIFGQQVAIAATVSSNAGTPTGTVTFYDGTTALGTATLNGSGQATFITSTLTAGTHTVSVGYGGDENFDPGTSLAVAQMVAKAATTITLTSRPNPSTTGQTVNFFANVAGQYGGAATGTVTFKEGTKTTLGTASLVNGSATLPLSTLGAGTHMVTAVYGGDANSNGSMSPAITQTVSVKTATTTTVSSSLNPSFVGQSVTFTATVSPSAATGTVTFKAGQTVLGTGSLSSGMAAFSTSSLSAGSFNIVAVYGGDAQFASSTSGSLTQTVNKASTTTVLGSSPNPSSVGQLVMFTAKVTSSTGVTPSGTVSFNEGGTTLGTGTLDGSGTATFSTSTLSKGKHNVKAVYGATSAFSGSTSAVITQIVQ
jgi:probable HAF family extracellular repeat protein